MDPELEPGHGQKADQDFVRRLLTIQRYFPDFIEVGLSEAVLQPQTSTGSLL